MDIFEEKTHGRVMRKVLGLVDVYNDLQEGKIGFEFQNKSFELSTEFIESSSEEDVIDFVRALSVPNKEIGAKVTSQTKIMIHAGILGLNERYKDAEVESLDDATIERIKADKWLKMAHSLAKKNSPSREANTFSTSKAKIAQAVEQINKLRKDVVNKTDNEYQNKWGETVYVRDILIDDKKVGAIEYLEDDKSVTILRADVDQDIQGKGIGFSAYKKLLSEKIRLGKSVGSDNILSKPAQRIYEKLGEEGYMMLESPKYLMPRGKLTSIDREDRLTQRKEVPTEHVDGAIVAAGGYRMKGESIYTILPSFAPEPCPVIRINEIDINTNESIETVINPSYVESSNIIGGASDLDQELYGQIEELLLSAKNELKHESNTAVAELLKMENVSIWQVDRVCYEELVEVNRFFHPDVGYDYEGASC